ncbi:hypothetical protein AB1Y20_006468 [Prymnesium parvum]|uniref:Uncharacterized protein n=1 Tax=Prymnesium parvum TaxID=97485 RepID=A0AB34IYV1_PRYPA
MAALAFALAAARPPLPPRLPAPPRAHPTCQLNRPEPPLSPEQASFLSLRGYTWDGSRWVRGDAASLRRRAAECRSGARVARLVDAAGRAPASGDAVRAATRHLEGAVQAARSASLADDEASRARDVRVKDWLAAKYAPYAWGAAQLGVGAAALPAAGLEWGAGGEWRAAAVGLAAAPLLVGARRELRRCHASAGVEGASGKLERLIVDAALGSHALPAPWSWRCSEPSWRALGLLFELVASSNLLGLLHGVIQATVSESLSHSSTNTFLVASAADTAVGAYVALCAPAVAVLFVGLMPALSELYFFGDPVMDGVPAEIEAARRTSKNAETYFTMKATRPIPPEEMAARVAVVRSLAAAWESFGRGGSAKERAVRAALAAGGAAVVTGGAWQLAGGAMVAPLVANAVALADDYLVSLEANDATVDVPLPAESEGF